MPEPYELSVAEAAKQIRSGNLSPVALAQSLLDRIDTMDGDLKAWVTIDREAVLSAAREREADVANGSPGLIHGVPVGLKDIFYTAGMLTACGSRVYGDFVPDFDATSVAKIKEAGGIILGKAVTTEFATSDPSPTHNPWNLEHTPGGSSSGSSAAVAARMVPAALGSQTGGSTCRPAAYNGIVGLKPTYGRISRYGVVPVSWSLDHVGILTRTVADAAMMLQVLSGADDSDPGSLREPVPDFSAQMATHDRPPRIGLVRQYYQDYCTEETWAHTEAVANRLAEAGAEVEEIVLPNSFARVHSLQRIVMNVGLRRISRRQPPDPRFRLRSTSEGGHGNGHDHPHRHLPEGPAVAAAVPGRYERDGVESGRGDDTRNARACSEGPQHHGRRRVSSALDRRRATDRSGADGPQQAGYADGRSVRRAVGAGRSGAGRLPVVRTGGRIEPGSAQLLVGVPPRADYDLIVIGAGSAGLVAARFARQIGLSVAMIERSRVGGDCTWTGCVPSKALLRAAGVAHSIRTANRFGLSVFEPQVDLRVVMQRIRSVIRGIYDTESPAALSGEGIEVIPGEASFTGPDSVSIDGRSLTARRFLVCTGASPVIPPLPGLDGVDYLTYETVWELDELPPSLAVIGAGAVGCELAQAFARLGSRVTLIEAADRLLPLEDPEVSEVLSRRFTAEGIDLRVGAEARSVHRGRGTAVSIELSEGTDVIADALLVAVGRRPNVAGLGLETAGVKYSTGGIQVDRRLRTANKRIYAAGDVTGGPQFTHYAGWQGFMAVRNAFLPGNATAVFQHVPRATFTDPEVAQAGMTEREAREQLGERAEVAHWPLDEVDRALTDGETEGFVKAVHQPNGRILGATIVAARAGEMVHEWTLAIDKGLKLGDFAQSIHVYPTYSMATQQLALRPYLQRLLGGSTGAHSPATGASGRVGPESIS